MLAHHHVLFSLAVAALVQGSALAWSATQTPRIMEAFSGASAALTAAATYVARGTYFPGKGTKHTNFEPKNTTNRT